MYVFLSRRIPLQITGGSDASRNRRLEEDGKMKGRVKIAPTGGSLNMMECRSDSAAVTPIQQTLSAFDDSADRRRSEGNADGGNCKRKKGEPDAVALGQKNVLNRCHHLDNSGGSRKNMASKPGMQSQSNNFLHDNDFTFIDADDDSQSIADEVVDAGRNNGCKSSDNASSMQNVLSAGRESSEAVENQHLSGGE